MYTTKRDVKLIRMESQTGNGPFREGGRIYNIQLDAEAVNYATLFKYQSHTKMKSAVIDFGYAFTYQHYCAYLNIKDFIRFWNEELALIAFLMSGFKIYELTVSECFCSETQVAFLKEHILHTREISFNEISPYYQQKAA